MRTEVKGSGKTRISGKHQVTLPVAALRAAHLEPGDELGVSVTGDGRIVLTASRDALGEFDGAVPGLSSAADVEGLRDEWER